MPSSTANIELSLHISRSKTCKSKGPCIWVSWQIQSSIMSCKNRALLLLQNADRRRLPTVELEFCESTSNFFVRIEKVPKASRSVTFSYYLVFLWKQTSCSPTMLFPRFFTSTTKIAVQRTSIILNEKGTMQFLRKINTVDKSVFIL